MSQARSVKFCIPVQIFELHFGPENDCVKNFIWTPKGFGTPCDDIVKKKVYTSNPRVEVSISESNG